MGRSEEFGLGAITHHHMLSLANAEAMEIFHGSWGEHYRKTGHSAKASSAWNASAVSARQTGDIFTSMKPMMTEKGVKSKIITFNERSN